MQNFSARDIAYIASFAALIIVLGAIAIPVGTAGVPIVLQNMGVLLTAMLLGSLRGGLATALFLTVGLVGVPNLSGWNTTIAALAGPTVGYLVGYLISAFVIGAIAHRGHRTRRSPFFIFLIAGLVGLLIQYACGVMGLMIRLGIDANAALATNVPFLPGDALKLFAAAAIATAVTKAVPDLLPTTPKRKVTARES